MSIIKRLWWKVVPPKELRQVRVHVRSWLKEHADISGTTIQAEIAHRDYVATATVDAIRKRGMAAEDFALVLIFNALESMLTTGRFHVHRGRLNMVGKDAFSTLRRVVADMQAKRLMDTGDEYLDFIRQEIRNVG